MFLCDFPKELIKPYLNLAFTLIHADGVVEESETDILQLYTKELNLDTLPKLELVDYSETLKAFDNLSPKLKKEIYFELFSLSYADSSCSDEERKLLHLVCREFNINEKEAEMLEKITIKLLFDYEQLGLIING